MPEQHLERQVEKTNPGRSTIIRMKKIIKAQMLSLVICSVLLCRADCLKEVLGRNEKEGSYIYQDLKLPNFILGGYFAVHKSGSTSTCGELDRESGIYLLEAMRYTINKINANSSLLFGAKLGFRIFDTCGSIEKLKKDIQHMMKTGRMVGIVGPPTSDEAIIAATAFDVSTVPIISFYATSIDLADRARYNNFFRTVPADNFQADALLDILVHYNWTYITTVNSYGNYGQRGMDNLIAMMASRGICIATRNVLPQRPKKSHFEMVVRNLNADPQAKVVVLFTIAEDTYRLLKTARSGRKFTWLSSSAWTADQGVVRKIEDVAKGAIMLSYAGINNQEFRNHFMGLKHSTNSKYKWFDEFWENTFNCSLKQINNKKFCTGNESLNNNNFFGRYAPVNPVINAVKSYACAIRNGMLSNCRVPGINRTICANTADIGRVKRYITNAFSNGTAICEGILDGTKFDRSGAHYLDFEVVNFDGKNYKTVGIWSMNATTKKGTLKMSNTKITWSHDGETPPISICSLPCKTGEITIKSATKICCFTCKSCGIKGYVSNNTCAECGNLEIPNKQRTACNKLPVFSHSFKNLAVQLTLAGSIIGICLTTGVLYLFVKHKDAKIIKASSRELSLVILIGLYLGFISPIFFYLKPTPILCGLGRFIFGTTFTMCYTPLMLKTNRIFRIFKAANTATALPQLVSPKSQIVICLGLLGIQLLLCVMWVVGQPSVIQHIVHVDHVAVYCKSNSGSFIITLVPCFCLMSVSTVYAFKTRKFPKNYNEASSIGITMYISCFLWASLIPLLLLVKMENTSPFAYIYTMTNFSNVLGLVTLIGLFWPKVHRVLFIKEDSESQIFFTQKRKDFSSADTSIHCSIGLPAFGVIEMEEKGLADRERSKTF